MMNEEYAKIVLWLVDVQDWEVSWDKRYDYYGLWHWDKNTIVIISRRGTVTEKQIRLKRKYWPFWRYSIVFLEGGKDPIQIDGNFSDIFNYLESVIRKEREIKIEDWK